VNFGSRMQAAQITWGSSQSLSFVGATGFVLNNTPIGAQVLRLESDRARVWLITCTVDVSGFDSETASLSVLLKPSAGVGQANVTVVDPTTSVLTLSPPYAQAEDQGFQQAQSLQLQALATGGPFIQAVPHMITVTAAAAPWTNDHGDLLEELRALRGDVAQLTAALLGRR